MLRKVSRKSIYWLIIHSFRLIRLSMLLLLDRLIWRMGIWGIEMIHWGGGRDRGGAHRKTWFERKITIWINQVFSQLLNIYRLDELKPIWKSGMPNLKLKVVHWIYITLWNTRWNTTLEIIASTLRLLGNQSCVLIYAIFPFSVFQVCTW